MLSRLTVTVGIWRSVRKADAEGIIVTACVRASQATRLSDQTSCSPSRRWKGQRLGR
jgi:hypothetical protein